MTPLLLRIGAAAFLAATSLLVILFRVSPLVSPGIAIPLFFLTVYLTAAGFGTLAAYGAWSRISVEGMDAGKKVSIALREGLFLATAIVLLLLFQILGIMTWWIGLLIVLVFVLVEVALNS